MQEWRMTTIAECSTILGDGLHGTPKYDENGEYAFINGNNLHNGKIVIKPDTKRVGLSEYEKHKKELTDRTVLVSINGTLGNVAVYNGEKVILGKSACYFNVSTDCDVQFMRYVVSSPRFQQYINSVATGTTIKTVSLKQMREYSLLIPELEEHQRIAKVLHLLDQKIENNQKINDNLQQQIKSLVTAWLVDYIPFGGEMPSDWCTISLATIADFVSGYSYKGAELQPSTTAMATIKNFDRNGGFKLDGFKELVPSSKIKPCHYAEKFDVIVAHTDLTQKAEVIGNAEPIINLSGYESIVFSMDLVKVVSKDTRVSKFLLAALLQHPRFKAHCLGYVNGTTVLHLSKKALPDYELDFPTDPAVLVPLDDALRVLYMQMATIVDENRKLQDLRDTLLPRLMSGQIDVTDIDF